MSGPPYPRYAPGAAPGQNAIGQFIIGESPVGDIPPFDLWQTVISQYANSSILTALVQDMAQWLDPTVNYDAFFDTVFNVLTALGNGLDIWGRIVGVNRVVNVPTAPGYLGFEEAGAPLLRTPFGSGIFFGGVSAITNFALSDTAYRTLIIAKALANICDGSLPAINQVLMNLFGTLGNCFVIDGSGLSLSVVGTFAEAGGRVGLSFGDQLADSVQGLSSGATVIVSGVGGTVEANGTWVIDVVNQNFNRFSVSLRGSTWANAWTSGGTLVLPGAGRMTMTYSFQSELSQVQLAIVQSSGVLPRTAGVATAIVQG